MAVTEGGVSGALAGVGAEASSPLHTVRMPLSYGAGGVYRIGTTSTTMAAALAANSEIFQFRYVTAASRLCLVQKVSISCGANVAASAAAITSLRMTAARSWTANGTGGAASTLTTNNCKLRTSMATTEVAEIRTATTTALGAGTKTLDASDIGQVAIGIGTGAITVSVPLNLLGSGDGVLFDADGEGQHPLVCANQEGFVIRSGVIFPAGLTWNFAVNVLWAEVPAF